MVNRRTLLATVTATVHIPIAGCLGDVRDVGYDDDEDGTTSATACDSTDAQAPIEIDSYPGIDEPPHEIERPDDPADITDYDWDEDYLGSCMAKEPSREFEPLNTRIHLRDRFEDDHRYEVRLLAEEADAQREIDLLRADEDTTQTLDAINFDESVIVIVRTGWGSGSLRHRWVRVEDAGRGIHLHGYYTDPYDQTADDTVRSSSVRVDRPDDGIETVRVSLTVNRDTRVHFDDESSPITTDEL